MTRIWTLVLAGLAVLHAAAAAPSPSSTPDPGLELGMLAGARVMLPRGPALGTVILFSGDGGWGEEEHSVAAGLAANGTAVIGVDLPAYLATLNAAEGECVYTVSDIESVGHQIGRATGSSVFAAPAIAGRGAGGALVLDILAQTPVATLGAAVAVDPTFGAGLTKRLCTPADLMTTPEGANYVLPAGEQPAPLSVIESVSAGSDSRARVRALTREQVAFTFRRVGKSPELALADGIEAVLAGMGASAADLPVSELPAAPTRDTLAIVISGDGGWRDLDRSVAIVLQSQGVPTIGLDALHYFWSKRSPEETARDLTRLIETYTARWKVSRVVLIGYSFGAAVLPAAFGKLPSATAARISQVSLLGIATRADWEISVSGWLGSTSAGATATGPALAAMPASLVQCFYGKEESDSACPSLTGTGAEVIMIDGGHHFDGNYKALAERILNGLDRRSATAKSGN